MEIFNATPLKVMPFYSLDSDRSTHFTLVLRGTFKIIPDQTLKLLDGNDEGMEDEATHRDIIVADIYYDDPTSSSLHWPNDLAPFKPNTDIHLIGNARSEDKKLLPHWLAKINIGEHQAAIEIHGAREWLPDDNEKWRLSDSIPCNELALRYEFASGGTWGDTEEGGFSEFNPIGRGCYDPQTPDKDKSFPAPQILAVGQSIPLLGETVLPKGVGPLPPAWKQRLQHAGTYDEDWEEHQHPLPPHDFKYDFYNSANPDLVYPGYLQGGENVILEGFFHEGRVSFDLPLLEIIINLKNINGENIQTPALIDTLQIDLEKKLVYIVWRAFVKGEETYTNVSIEIIEK